VKWPAIYTIEVDSALGENILEVKSLQKFFPIKKGILSKAAGVVKAVNGVSLQLERGRKFAIVGESGSGKTTLGKTIVRLYEPTGGEIWADGREISHLKGPELKSTRMQMQMVFQDPASSLNPRRSVKAIISSPLDVHNVGTREDRSKRVRDLLNIVELSEDYMNRAPGALSGGEKQRVAIARALALNPKLIVLDEPTSSLDVSVQAKILTLLDRLQKESNLTYLLITHDLSVVRNFADMVSVMYRGRIVESSTTNEIFTDAIHPYTKTLLSALPVIYDEELSILPKADSTEYLESQAASDSEFHLVEAKKGHWVEAYQENELTASTA